MGDGLGGGVPEFVAEIRRGRQQLLLITRNEPGIQLRRGKRRMADDPAQEVDVGLEPADRKLIEHAEQPQARLFTVLAPGNQLAEHRIVEGRNLVAFFHATVHPTARTGRGFAIQLQASGGRQEVVGRVFGVQAHFNCMTEQRHLILGHRQRFTARHANLPGHQVEAGDGFGDRVFDLQAGVHLHEEELAAGIQQKFHGTGTDVPDGLGRTHRGFAHGTPQFRAQARGGCFLDDFLMPTLNRAVPFIEVQAVAVLVGEHLDFHMARFEQVFLHQHPRIAERGLRFTLGRGQGFGELADLLDHFHAFAAAARRGLEQHRVADAFAGVAEGLEVLGFAVIARHQRHASGFHQGFGRGFTAHGVDGRGGWAKEDQAGGFDSAGEPGVLGQEAIPRMDRLGATGLGRGNQFVDLQVAVGGFAAAEVDANIRFAAMARVAVSGAVHGHGGQAQGLGGPHDPAGDFAAVGHQQGGENRCAHQRDSLGVVAAFQIGARFCRKARKPSWPSGLTRMRAMAFSV
ncbi:hypothetical protein PS639_06045 [Pseudomonas fluorescens]|nr:hypothetical protein PS639_06045 [Pseudomonas fluorescens]